PCHSWNPPSLRVILTRNNENSNSDWGRTPRVVEFTNRAKELIAAAKFEVDFAFKDDAPSDTAYKPYDPDAEKPATQIYVEALGSGQVELSQQSESVKQLTKKYTLVRYYYPADVRDEIRRQAEPLLEKE
ncbi:MAG: hypothetical protein JW809_12320, partial [Pirellulales bacterium]|nr:hypothetical protein [Pirellulales bacterium]